jgi:hypothetical protein
MQNLIDSKMGEARAKVVTSVLRELGLHGLRVFHDVDLKQYRFVQDRHVVKVPESLIERQAWADLRFLFRAILGSAPSLTNTGSPNDWGTELSYSAGEQKDPVRT